jgi:hypothetical protein
LEKYKDIFASELHELGKTNIITHKINTGNAAPIRQRAYRTSIPDQEFIHNEVQKMLNSGIIRYSTSLWASLIVVIPKKNGKK